MAKVSLKKKIIFIISGIFLSVVLLEVGIRLGGFIFMSMQEHRNKISMSQKDSYRILCLGESTTAGGADSYPVQLEEILNQHNLGIKFVVINKGIVGTNTSVIVSNLETTLNEYNPDMIIAMMGVNDKYIKYYEHIPHAQGVFFNKCKTYKLIRLLWMHLLDKSEEISIHKINDDKILTNSSFISYPEPEDKPAVQTESKPNKEPDTDNYRLYVELGGLYRQQGKLKESEAVLKKAIELNPGNDHAYTELGICYRYQGMLIEPLRFSESEMMFKKAMELNPGNKVAFLELGQCYIDQYKYLQAEETFKKAIELNPGDRDLLFELGMVYMKENKFAQAEKIFKAAIKTDPNYDRPYAALAILYEEMDERKLSKEYQNKANELMLGYYNHVTLENYQKMQAILNRRGIRLVCAQYPMRSIEHLKRMFDTTKDVIFVDNEKIFKDAIEKSSYREYFIDVFGGDFGHCTYKGDRLLADNIANVILKECFNK